MVEKATDKDELTSVIGTHGKFQLRVFLIVQFVGVFAAWQILVSTIKSGYFFIFMYVCNLDPDILTPQSSSFHLPEVEFWCSPAELGLAPGPPPSARLSPAPAPGNTTDPCLMWDLDYGGLDTEDMQELVSSDTVPNTTHCSRWDFDRSGSPESVVSQFSLVCR